MTKEVSSLRHEAVTKEGSSLRHEARNRVTVTKEVSSLRHEAVNRVTVTKEVSSLRHQTVSMVTMTEAVSSLRHQIQSMVTVTKAVNSLPHEIQNMVFVTGPGPNPSLAMNAPREIVVSLQLCVTEGMSVTINRWLSITPIGVGVLSVYKCMCQGRFASYRRYMLGRLASH